MCPSKKDPQMMVLLSREGQIILLENLQTKMENKLEFQSECTCLEINEELGEIYVGTKDGHIYILNFSTFEKVGELFLYNYEVTSLVLDPFSKRLAATDAFRYLIIWDLQTQKVFCQKYSNRFGVMKWQSMEIGF